MDVRAWPHRPNPNYRDFRHIWPDRVTITTWAPRLTGLTRYGSTDCISVPTRFPMETSLVTMASITEMARADRVTEVARITIP